MGQCFEGILRTPRVIFCGSFDIVDLQLHLWAVFIIFHTCQQVGSEELGHALIIGNVFSCCGQVSDEPGNHSGGVAEVHEGKMAEKIIHWLFD